jgi:hypothetical protein
MNEKITCTRCLGKGYVDKKDIKRLSRGLNRVSEWDENSDCRFCEGKGKITEKFASKYNPDSEKFPNVTDYSGLVNFMELTEEEKNKRFSQAIERAGGEINFNEEDSNELESNSQSKTIFWTSFVSVVLTLNIVLYFSGKFSKNNQNAFEVFYMGLIVILIFLIIPSSIIYRLLFGKINRNGNFFELFYFMAFASFAIFSKLMGELIMFMKPESFINGENEYPLIITSIIFSIIITKWFLKWMFFTKFKHDN